MNIGLPPLPLQFAGSASRPAGPTLPLDEANQGQFESLIREFEAGRQGATDFLGERHGGANGAHLFNAEGFFQKLEAALGEMDVSQGDAPADPSVQTPPTTAANGQGEQPAEAEQAIALRPAATPHPLPSTAPLEAGRAIPLGLARPASLQAAPQAFAANGSPPGRAALRAEPSAALKAPAGKMEAAPAHGAGRATPVRAFVGQGSVHVVGPLHLLSTEEEADLVRQVAELMAAHDLHLSDLWLNGRRYAAPGRK